MKRNSRHLPLSFIIAIPSAFETQTRAGRRHRLRDAMPTLLTALAIIASGVLLHPGEARAEEGEGITVVVDLDKEKASPSQPIVNGWLPDAAVLIELNGQKGKKVFSYPDVPQYKWICEPDATKSSRETCGGEWVLRLNLNPEAKEGRHTTMRVASCSRRAFEKHGLSDLDFKKGDCPFAVLGGGVPEASSSWTLFSEAGVVVWTFDIYDPKKPGRKIGDEREPCAQPKKAELQDCFVPVVKDGKAILAPCARRDPECVDGSKPKREERGEWVTSFSLPVHVARKPFALRWSAGFGFPSVSNERYRLEPVSDDSGMSEMASIVRVSDEENPYQLAAYAHWVPLAADYLALSAGLSTDVPIEELSIMAGVSVHLRTLPIKNGAFLTVGLAYVLEDHLRPTYEGVELVPVSLKPEDLVEGEAEFKLFFGLSFGFWGGEDKFNKVTSGSK